MNDTKLERNKFSTLMAMLNEYFDSPKISSLTKSYWTILKDYSFDDLLKSCEIIIRTRKYPSFPTVAEIIDQIDGMNKDRMYNQLCDEIENHDTISGNINPCIVNLMGGSDRIRYMKFPEFKRQYYSLYDRVKNEQIAENIKLKIESKIKPKKLEA